MILQWYQHDERFALKHLKNNPHISHVFFKGGYVDGQLVPLVSDIDIVVVCSIKDKVDLSIIYNKCAFIHEIDLLTYDELCLKLKYGSLKFSTTKNWRCIKGEIPDIDYFYHPQKVINDTIEEAYFYYEKFFENLKGLWITSYRKACIRRNLEKLRNRILFILDKDQKQKINQVEITQLNNRIEFIEAYLQLFDFLPNPTYREIYPYFKTHYNFSEKYFVKNKIYFNHRIYSLFFNNGSLDSHIHFKELSKSENRIFSFLQIITYYLKILEGKTNDIHKDDNSPELIKSVEKAIEYLNNYQVLKYTHHSNLDDIQLFFTHIKPQCDFDNKTVSWIQPSQLYIYLENIEGVHELAKEYLGLKMKTFPSWEVDKDYEIDKESKVHLDPNKWDYKQLLTLANYSLPVMPKYVTRKDDGLWSWKSTNELSLFSYLKHLEVDQTINQKTVTLIKPHIKNFIEHKTYNSVVYSSESKNIYSKDNVGSISLLYEKNQDLFFYGYGNPLNSIITKHFQTLKHFKTYSLSFKCESGEDLSKLAELSLKKIRNEDLNIKLMCEDKIYHGGINFYLYDEYPTPEVELKLTQLEELELKYINLLLEENLSKESSWDWILNQELHAESEFNEDFKIDQKLEIGDSYKLSFEKPDEITRLNISLKDYYGNFIYLNRSINPDEKYIELIFKAHYNSKYFFIDVDGSTSNNSSISFQLFRS